MTTARGLIVLNSLRREQEENLKGLVKELSGLNNTLRWFVGAMVGSFIASFFMQCSRECFNGKGRGLQQGIT